MLTLRRGTAVTYTFAAGKTVPGRVLREYAKDMPGWYLLEMTDEAGTFRGGCYSGQIRVTDNRPGYGWVPKRVG